MRNRKREDGKRQTAIGNEDLPTRFNVSFVARRNVQFEYWIELHSDCHLPKKVAVCGLPIAVYFCPFSKAIQTTNG